MLHYKTGFLGVEGQADGEAFYFSPAGKTDPVAELAATFAALDKSSREDALTDASAICRFPLRFEWLKDHFLVKRDPRTECPGLRGFIEKVSARSVSLIFSSYFIDSPASAFGHTFLRLNSAPHRSDDTDQAELLDYGINYAAVMDTSNVLVYATKSMLGLFPGTFTAVPYYYKVREYNDFESRDLWEYKLNFTQAQIDRMVLHMWELGQTHFDYKFFTENCSYHVLGLLEVGNTELNLTARLPALYVIPIDTVRVVQEEPGLLLGVRYRPSVLARLEHRSLNLPKIELERVWQLTQAPENAEALLSEVPDARRRADILDTAVDAFDFVNAKALVHQTQETNRRRHPLLVARATTDHVSEPLRMTPPKAEFPENGHRSQRWGFGAGSEDGRGGYAFASMRFALHDLLDPLPGQPTFSEIHFAGLYGRLQQTDYGEATRLEIDSLDFFRVSSFQPVTTWRNSFSWTAKLGLRKIQDEACDSCLAGTLDAGTGVTLAPAKSESFVALLTKFEVDHSPDLRRNWRFVVGPEVWARWVISKKISSLATIGYKWSQAFEAPLFAAQLFTHSLEVRYHASREWSLALKGQRIERQHASAQLGLYRFF